MRLLLEWRLRKCVWILKDQNLKSQIFFFSDHKYKVLECTEQTALQSIPDADLSDFSEGKKSTTHSREFVEFLVWSKKI